SNCRAAAWPSGGGGDVKYFSPLWRASRRICGYSLEIPLSCGEFNMRPSRLPFRLASRAAVRPLLILLASLLLLSSRGIANERSTDSQTTGFQAGAYAQNIDPETLPVWVNGGFVGKQVDRIRDTLFARCLVLSDGSEKV